MNRWRGSWATAQITGVIFSSLGWIVVSGLSFPALVVAVAVGVALVIGCNTRPMLWWRFGATRPNDFQRDTMLTAIVPIPSLRGRHQPSVWIGRRIIGGQVVMPSSTALVVSPQFVGQVASGQLTDRQASAVISQSLGDIEVVDSTLVNVLDAYCVPWRLTGPHRHGHPVRRPPSDSPDLLEHPLDRVRRRHRRQLPQRPLGSARRSGPDRGAVLDDGLLPEAMGPPAPGPRRPTHDHRATRAGPWRSDPAH